MTEIIFVRHGETVWHAENRYAGISDIALTAKGLEQGKKLANWAETAQLSAIYSSELKRAKLTAEFSCQKTGLELNVEKRLNEVNFGEGEGLTRDEMKLNFPEELAKFIDFIITSNSYWEGVKHIYSPNTISKFELISSINNIYNLNISLLEKINENCFRNLSSNFSDHSFIKKRIFDQILELKSFELDK